MELRFINPIVHKGLNLTVRRGIKWAKKAETGQMVGITGAMWEKDGYLVDYPGGVAIIREMYLKRCIDITEHELQHHHDPKCKNMGGLIGAMKHAYSTFDKTEIVTLVFFEMVNC